MMSAAIRPERVATRRDRVVLRTLARDPRQRWYCYAPDAVSAAGTVLVAVHGVSRDAREQALAWRALARRLGCVLIAPLFEKHAAPGYQRLGWDDDRVRADHLLDAMVDEAAAEFGLQEPRLVLAGYSGGAQFCHRYAMAHPARVRALICGAAGWYTWPDAARAWPYGADVSHLAADRRVDLDVFLRVPTLVYVGDRDVEPGASLRSTPELDAWQGPDRRERARRWTAALRAAQRARALPARAQLRVLPLVGHEFRGAVHAGVVDLAAHWLLGVLPFTHGREDRASTPSGDFHAED